MQEIESGNSSVPRWNLFSPDSVFVSCNIDRGSKLRRVIEFLAGEKADIGFAARSGSRPRTPFGFGFRALSVIHQCGFCPAPSRSRVGSPCLGHDLDATVKSLP
jgi:hypothetical protein